MDEVDVEAVDLNDELRQGVQLRLAVAPVVLRLPVLREFLHHFERNALGLIRDGLLLGPVGGRDASAEVVQCLVRDVDVEGADVGGGLDGAAHDVPSSRNDRNAARISVAKSCGSSQAAKWPPLSTSLK